MKLPLYIAFRYLFTFRKFHFITFITIISMCGIIIGVAALIIVMSIFNGFGEFTEKQLIGYDPHLRIISKDTVWLKDYNNVLNYLNSNDLIKGFSPVLEGKVILINKDNMKVAQLFGYEPEKFHAVSGLDQNMINGNFDIDNEQGKDKVVLGSGLSFSIRSNPGEYLEVMSLYDIENSIMMMSRQQGKKIYLSGMFLTNNQEYDDAYAITSLPTASHLLNAPPNSISAIDVRLKDIEKSEHLKNTIIEKFSNLEVLTWYDLHKELYNILKLERIAVFVILSLIIIIAVFNVLAALAMTVVEKRPDIAVLKTIGANDSCIYRIYIILGLIIGGISTFVGTILGLGLSFGQIYFQWFKLNSADYLIPAIPVSVNLVDVLLVICISLFLSFISTIYPSKRASSTNIIEALREE